MALIDIVRTKEQELRLLRSEVGVAYDCNGNIVLQKRSKPNEDYEIEFTDAEVELLRTTSQVTFTHNHPRGWNYDPDDARHVGNSFSPEDILFACRAELAEIRAVSPKMTYSMRSSPLGWTEVTWNQEIRPLYELIYQQVKTELYSAALRRAISPQEASARLDHEIWTQVAGMVGLRYNGVEE